MRIHDDHTGLREQARLVDEHDRAIAAAKELRAALVEHHMPAACPDCDKALDATAWLEDL